MKVIDRIRAIIASREIYGRFIDNVDANYLVALVEYYEAAEAKFQDDHRYKLHKASLFDIQKGLNRYLAARAALEKEEG